MTAEIVSIQNNLGLFGQYYLKYYNTHVSIEYRTVVTNKL